MIKLTISGTTEKLYDFIKNRFILLLAEQKLHYSTSLGIAKFSFNKSAVVETIEDTVLFFEKDSERASMLLRCAEKKHSKIEHHPFGLAVRKKTPKELEIYIDNFGEAMRKGIVKKDIINKGFADTLKVILIIAVLFAFLVILNVFAIFLILFVYPFYYLIQKRKFKYKQKVMNKVVSIFESEFKPLQKSDTRDWINFWGRVKSGAEELILPPSR